MGSSRAHFSSVGTCRCISSIDHGESSRTVARHNQEVNFSPAIGNTELGASNNGSSVVAGSNVDDIAGACP